MLTMLWLYLVTNGIIKMTGGESIFLLLSVATLVSDGYLIAALRDRIRGKQE